MRALLLLLAWCLSGVALAAQAPSSFATRIDELRERIEAATKGLTEATAK